MSTHTTLVSLVLLAAMQAVGGEARAQKVYVDYDRAVPFSQYRTFQVHETRQDLRHRNPSVHEKVVADLRRYLQAGGLEEVESDPDVYVAYYVARDRSLQFAMTDPRYAYGPDFHWGTYWSGSAGTRTPQGFTFQEGALIIDVWDAEERQLVWRGIATSKIADDPEKNAGKVDQALQKLIKEWEAMYGAQARALRTREQNQR